MWYYDLISPRHISIRTFYHWYILRFQFLYQCNVHVVLVMLTLNVWQFYVMLSMLMDLYVLRCESIIFIIGLFVVDDVSVLLVGVIMFVGGIKKKRKHTVRL